MRRACFLLPVALVALLGACRGKNKPKFSPPAQLSVALAVAPSLWFGPPPKLTGGQLTIPGLLVGRNDDDSDGDGSPDYQDETVNGDDDARQLTSFIINKLTSTPASGDLIHLEKRSSGGGDVRVFRKTAAPASANVILKTAAAPRTSAADAAAILTDARAADVELWIEGTAPGAVELCAVYQGSASAEGCANLFVVNGFGPRILADTNRDGNLVLATDDNGHTAWSASRGAIAVVNKDKDCPAVPGPDASDTKIACDSDRDQDITQFKIDRGRINLTGAPSGWAAVLRYQHTAADAVRLFDGAATGSNALSTSAVMVNGVSYDQADITALATGSGELLLGLEALAYDRDFEIVHCVTHVATATDAGCDKAAIHSSPSLLQANSEPGRTLYVVQMCFQCPAGAGCVCPFPGVVPTCPFTNCPVTNTLTRTPLSSLPAGLSFSLIPATSPADQWAQDETEMAGLRAPRPLADMQLVLHLPRNPRGAMHTQLEGWAQSLVGPNLGYEDTRTLAGVNPIAGNYGGNLEVSPATSTSPGQMIHGDTMEAVLIARLDEISSQTLVSLPTSWLLVGHVDEMMAVYPVGGAWKVAVSDPSRGQAILNSAPARAALFWHCKDSARARSASCYGYGNVASASAKAGATPARLTTASSGFQFTGKPAGHEWQWVRIYDGPGKGQVAHISALNPHSIDVDVVWTLTNPEWIRCFATSLFDELAGNPWHGACDPAAPVPTTRSQVVRETWFALPTSASKFVIVEDTLDWAPSAPWNAVLSPSVTKAVPALHTAGELRQTTGDYAEFWRKEGIIQTTLNSVATTLATLPGAGAGTIVRVPGLYVSIASGASAVVEGEAFLPGGVNFQVAPGTSTVSYFAARQYGPTTGGVDPFEAQFNSQLGVTVTFIDDWDIYHTASGEVHCGTNVTRAHARRWWP